MRLVPRLTFSLLLLLALLPGFAAAQAPPAAPPAGRVVPLSAFPPHYEVEPNDLLDDANPIGHAAWFASHVSGRIDPPDDVDLFTFWGLAGDRIVVAVAAHRYGSSLDAEIALLDSDGNWLAYSDDNDNDDSNLDSYLEMTLPRDGQYSVQIDAMGLFDNGANSWYDLFFYARSRSSVDTVPYAPGSEEPNNSRATATAVAYGDTLPFGQIGASGDVDYYKFTGQKGDTVRISTETTGFFGGLKSKLALYNKAGKLLAACGPANWGPVDTNCLLTKVLPATGTYFLKVSDAENRGGGNYWLQVGFAESFEPNDSPATATYLSHGQTVRGLTAQGDEYDVFKFYGWANEYTSVFSDGQDFDLLDSDQHTELATTYFCGGFLSLTLAHDGWYYIVIYPRAYTSPDGESYGAYTLTAAGTMMLAGMTANGTAGGVSYAKSDILVRYPASGQWRLFLDGSDVGLNGNVRDFVFTQDNACLGGAAVQPSAILMSLAAKTVLPGYPAITALPQDLVLLRDPWPGDSSWGYWEMGMDGSDIGLTTTAEAIDAVGRIEAVPGLVLFSTVGTATITSLAGPLTAQDEDLVACAFDSLGWDTRGRCSLYFDGSAAGLPATADVASLWVDPPYSHDLHLTFAATTVVNGVTYLANDVAVCHPASAWPPAITSCQWQAKYWSGNFMGLSGNAIDGFDLLSPVR